MRRMMNVLTATLMAVSFLASGCGRDDDSASKLTPLTPSVPSVQRTQPASPAQPTEDNAEAAAAGAASPTQDAPVHPVGSSAIDATTPTLPAITAPKTPGDPKVATFAGFTAPKPATWIWHPPQRQFSVAEYAVPGRDGHDQARIDVFKAGGTIEMNINRWRTQFRDSSGGQVEPVITDLESDGVPITLVEFAGEYKGMGMVNWAKDQVFLCAIVHTPGEMVFIRFVGPRGTVEPNRADYMTMIQNLKRIEPEK